MPLTGLGFAALLWTAGSLAMANITPIATHFAPLAAAHALGVLLGSALFWEHIAVSLQRVGVGLLFALAIGVPIGILTGMSRAFAQASTPLFQFLRMISPLSWMPIAVMVLGVGDAPVYFLLAFAAVWPILLNTAAGVAQLDRNWLLLARSLSATRCETICRVIVPGITASILSGTRLAIGIIWIVLVPAEMLGVSAGLGYFILDARDRLAYSELMAAILVIGCLGFFLDHLARRLHRCWIHQR
ncbi:ABC transporter permease [Candidatus Methylospira mobilis]|uniref:ABC transporter permease n=1 Tax=Candidatus Methylospira mobilis TaxID=1808979 RepID=UPI0028E6AD6E|nr:ABC transporter permease [Candidatus Methylospira mobilis]WNV06395.1 ABC transporter permease [Candidatus Methylospira mobilis]